MSRDAIQELADLIRESGAKMCFCTLCSHRPEYGHCYVCNCHNGRKRPAIPDPTKLLATIDHLRDLLIRVCKDKLRVSQPPEGDSKDE